VTDFGHERGGAVNDVPDDPIQRCFDASYRRLVGQLYGVCGDLTEAEEVVAEAFARAVASRRAFERVDQPEAWLRAVAVNVARTRHRRRVVGERLLGRSAARADAGVRRPDLTEDRLTLVAALRSLPQQQRETLALHYLADLPVATVAETLGVPVGTVKARLSRGRAALAVLLGVADGDSDQLVNGGSRG
jgi:RNA polymerase sigma-70 factor (ECF subfamily)